MFDSSDSSGPNEDGIWITIFIVGCNSYPKAAYGIIGKRVPSEIASSRCIGQETLNKDLISPFSPKILLEDSYLNASEKCLARASWVDQYRLYAAIEKLTECPCSLRS